MQKYMLSVLNSRGLKYINYLHRVVRQKTIYYIFKNTASDCGCIDCKAKECMSGLITQTLT